MGYSLIRPISSGIGLNPIEIFGINWNTLILLRIYFILQFIFTLKAQESLFTLNFLQHYKLPCISDV